ncbi:MAG: hypothetical protein PHZ26_01875 [Candidatus Gracilibacteria bacterium]|nr:hypothetical protein [Candidatus Gracilibacteria bacterium]MDD2908483.1 hypothetical protein [Candidatus Gracilibacteria bacterium]
MKNFRKIALTAAIITTGIVSFTANADESMTTTQTSKNKIMSEVKETKEEMKAHYEEMKAQRKNMIEENKELLNQAKENREDFKEENKGVKEVFKTLDAETQTQLKEAGEAYKDALDVLKEELTNSGTTAERKIEIDAEIKTLTDAHIAQIKELTGNSEEVNAFFAKRQELIAKNKELREQAKNARTEFRQGKDAQVEQYRSKYNNQLGTLLPKLKDTKLELVNSRIDALITKLEASLTMLEERKAKLLAQVISIKELIQEEQDNRVIVEEENALIEVVQ